jgi:hypothetical protein
MWARVPADGFEWRQRGQQSDTADGGRQKRLACCAAGCRAVRTVTWGSDLAVASDVTAPGHLHAAAAAGAAVAEVPEVAQGATAVTRKRFPKLTDAAGWKLVQTLEQEGRRTKRYKCSLSPTCQAHRVVVFDDERSVVVRDGFEGRHNH